MNKIIYKIFGMHCKSCEILIEDKLKEINPSWKIVVSNKSETAEIIYGDEMPNEELIKTELKKMGYEIGVQNQKPKTKIFFLKIRKIIMNY